MRSSLLRLVDERDEPRNYFTRRFLHQQMAFAFDDNSVDVCINQTTLLNQELSRSFFSSQHEHWHGQLRLGKLSKVLGILFEVAETSKPARIAPGCAYDRA